jgi:hypothetical protein
MTLKEKFADVLWSYEEQSIVPQIEKVSDNHAVGFADWITLNAYKDNVWKMYYTKDKEYTTNELLEIYKKEKGL